MATRDSDRPGLDGGAEDTGCPGLEALGGRRVLVTGASGFIGTHLVRRLAGAGALVHAVSRRPCSVDPLVVAGWQSDLRDATVTAELLRIAQPDVVFHLASRVSGQRDLDLVLPIFADNLQSTVNLLAAAAENGNPRMVLAGSMEEPHPGEKATMPSSPYAASKWACTAYAQMFHGLWGLPTVVLRIAMAYGPGQPDERKLIPYVITSLLDGQAPELGSGRREIDWVYIDDVVAAFVAAATAPSAAGCILDIGSGMPVGIRRTVELLTDLVGSGTMPRFGALQDRRHDSARIADPDGASSVIDWRPRVDLRDGLARTVEWYRSLRAHDSRAPAESWT